MSKHTWQANKQLYSGDGLRHRNLGCYIFFVIVLKSLVLAAFKCDFVLHFGARLLAIAAPASEVPAPPPHFCIATSRRLSFLRWLSAGGGVEGFFRSLCSCSSPRSFPPLSQPLPPLPRAVPATSPQLRKAHFSLANPPFGHVLLPESRRPLSPPSTPIHPPWSPTIALKLYLAHFFIQKEQVY